MDEESKVSDALYAAILNRMNYTWQPDEKTAQNIQNSIEEAQDYLRKRAGNAALSFESGDLRDLLITCVWYFVYNKRAEFAEEYAPELLTLRLTEGFGCGKEDREN